MLEFDYDGAHLNSKPSLSQSRRAASVEGDVKTLPPRGKNELVLRTRTITVSSRRRSGAREFRITDGKKPSWSKPARAAGDAHGEDGHHAASHQEIRRGPWGGDLLRQARCKASVFLSGRSIRRTNLGGEKASRRNCSTTRCRRREQGAVGVSLTVAVQVLLSPAIPFVSLSPLRSVSSR